MTPRTGVYPKVSTSEPPGVTLRTGYHVIDCGSSPASVSVSCFRGTSGVVEYHLCIRPTNYGATDAQLDWIGEAYRIALAALGLDAGTAVFRRFFCSDLANQAPALAGRSFSNPHSQGDPCAVSWVCQPPVPPVKVAMWAYHVNDPSGPILKTLDGLSLTLARGAHAHHWTTGITSPNGSTSHDQTRGVFESYEKLLRPRGLTLADHVVRTWLFVQNMDANYQGLVTARRELFAERGLTVDTHFIASTGVEGSCADAGAKVFMDAYAISGVRPEQISYLADLEHLSPTHVYGVTFERGVSLAYQDRKHVLLSGTASIDRHGKILYPGDVTRQLGRTLENMEALLAQAGATFNDMCVFIVYIRDPSDYEIAWTEMRKRFGHAPIEVIEARVCRPGWLVEVEGMAIIPATNPDLPAF